MARSAGFSAAATVTTMPDDQRDDHRARLDDRAGVRQVDPDRLEQLVDREREPDPARDPRGGAEQPEDQRLEPTEERIWRREAPSVRSMPNSRVRWATVIENVLKIWNAPTNSDTPANTSRAIRKKPRFSAMSSVCRCAASSPVSTWTWRGITRAIRSRSCSGVTPSAAATEIWSNWPTRSVIRCASGSSTCAMPAPPKLVSPSFVKPDDRVGLRLVRPGEAQREPTFRSPVSAVCVSIDASSGVRGLRPST